MKLTDRIRSWFCELDSEQQNFIAYLFLSISPLNPDKEKARTNSSANFLSLLNTAQTCHEEVGLCLAIISTMDFILRHFGDVDHSLDRYNELKEMRDDFQSNGIPTESEDNLLNTSSQRFANQKFAKDTWNHLKETGLTIEEIERYFYLNLIR